MKVPRFGRMTLLSTFALFGVLALAWPPEGGFHLLKKIPLRSTPGTEEYFDYLTFDSAKRRVYVSHGYEVKVVDADTGDVAGVISGMTRCHGIALVNDLGKGFITDGGAGEVVIFDVASLKVTGKIKTEPDADGIIYDPASKHIFSFNGDSHSVSVIDPENGTLIKSLALPGSPEFAVADGKGMVYDNLEDKNEIVAIDSQALTIEAQWPVAPAGGPTALAMDREHRRLFSSGRNPQTLMMMDADNGKVLQSFPISAGADANVFEPETGMLFVSTREGMIHVFHEDSPDKLREVETIKTEYGAKTMALDSQTHNLYVSTADFTPASSGAQGRTARRRPILGTFRLLVYGR
jgi:hypothetical protein